MAVDKDYILDISSDFESVDSGRIDRLVARLEYQVPASIWGRNRDLALAYLVMHTIQVGDKLKGKGAIKREKLGDIEREFAVSTGAAVDDYSLTAWGQAFLRLRRQIVVTPMVAP